MILTETKTKIKLIIQELGSVKDWLPDFSNFGIRLTIDDFLAQN